MTGTSHSGAFQRTGGNAAQPHLERVTSPIDPGTGLGDVFQCPLERSWRQSGVPQAGVPQPALRQPGPCASRGVTPADRGVPITDAAHMKTPEGTGGNQPVGLSLAPNKSGVSECRPRSRSAALRLSNPAPETVPRIAPQCGSGGSHLPLRARRNVSVTVPAGQQAYPRTRLRPPRPYPRLSHVCGQGVDRSLGGAPDGATAGTLGRNE